MWDEGGREKEAGSPGAQEPRMMLGLCDLMDGGSFSGWGDNSGGLFLLFSRSHLSPPWAVVRAFLADLLQSPGCSELHPLGHPMPVHRRALGEGTSGPREHHSSCLILGCHVGHQGPVIVV